MNRPAVRRPRKNGGPGRLPGPAGAAAAREEREGVAVSALTTGRRPGRPLPHDERVIAITAASSPRFPPV